MVVASGTGYRPVRPVRGAVAAAFVDVEAQSRVVDLDRIAALIGPPPPDVPPVDWADVVARFAYHRWHRFDLTMTDLVAAMIADGIDWSPGHRTGPLPARYGPDLSLERPRPAPVAPLTPSRDGLDRLHRHHRPATATRSRCSPHCSASPTPARSIGPAPNANSAGGYPPNSNGWSPATARPCSTGCPSVIPSSTHNGSPKALALPIDPPPAGASAELPPRRTDGSIEWCRIGSRSANGVTGGLCRQQ